MRQFGRVGWREETPCSPWVSFPVSERRLPWYPSVSGGDIMLVDTLQFSYNLVRV